MRSQLIVLLAALTNQLSNDVIAQPLIEESLIFPPDNLLDSKHTASVIKLNTVQNSYTENGVDAYLNSGNSTVLTACGYTYLNSYYGGENNVFLITDADQVQENITTQSSCSNLCSNNDTCLLAFYTGLTNICVLRFIDSETYCQSNVTLTGERIQCGHNNGSYDSYCYLYSKVCSNCQLAEEMKPFIRSPWVHNETDEKQQYNYGYELDVATFANYRCHLATQGVVENSIDTCNKQRRADSIMSCASLGQYCCDGVCVNYGCCPKKPVPDVFDTIEGHEKADKLRMETINMTMEHYKNSYQCPNDIEQYVYTINGNVSLSAQSFVVAQAQDEADCFNDCATNDMCITAVFGDMCLHQTLKDNFLDFCIRESVCESDTHRCDVIMICSPGECTLMSKNCKNCIGQDLPMASLIPRVMCTGDSDLTVAYLCST